MTRLIESKYLYSPRLQQQEYKARASESFSGGNRSADPLSAQKREFHWSRLYLGTARSEADFPVKEIVHQTLICRPNGSVYNKEIWSFVLKQEAY